MAGKLRFWDKCLTRLHSRRVVGEGEGWIVTETERGLAVDIGYTDGRGCYSADVSRNAGGADWDEIASALKAMGFRSQHGLIDEAVSAARAHV